MKVEEIQDLRDREPSGACRVEVRRIPSRAENGEFLRARIRDRATSFMNAPIENTQTAT